MPFTWNIFTISADSIHDAGCACEIEQKNRVKIIESTLSMVVDPFKCHWQSGFLFISNVAPAIRALDCQYFSNLSRVFAVYATISSISCPLLS